MILEKGPPEISDEIIQSFEIEGLGEDTALIFPGQGTQEEGMGKDLCLYYPGVRNFYQRADNFLRSCLDEVKNLPEKDKYDWSLVNLASKDFGKNHLTQLAIFTYNEACRIASNQKRKSEGLEELRPKFYAGNSLGEYNALYAAGAFESLEDVLGLLIVRGKSMQRACDMNPGSLYAASIKTSFSGTLTPEQISIFSKIKSYFSNNKNGYYLEANNSPSQFVFGGSHENLDRANFWLKENGYKQKGIRLTPLNSAGVFHSELMRPADAEFSMAVKELIKQGKIKDIQTSVIANTTGKPITKAWQIGKELIDHLTKPVLWLESMEFFESSKVSATLELGRRNPLTNMMKDKGASTAVKVGAVGFAALTIGTILLWKKHQSKK